MSVQEIRTAWHVAYLDTTGHGLLVLPEPERDVWLGTESLLATDWHAMLRQLDALGWELTPADDGMPWVTVGETVDRLHVVSLGERDHPEREPSDIRGLGAAWERLARAAGLRRGGAV